MYTTEGLAEDALIEARTRFDYPNGRGPVAVYKCGDCGQYHLTSKGSVNERLSLLQAQGKIKLQKEADHWERKFRNK